MDPRYKHYLKVTIKFTLATLWCGGISAISLALYHSYTTPASLIDVDALEQRITLSLHQESETVLAHLSGLESSISALQQELDDTNATLNGVESTQQSHATAIDNLTLDEAQIKELEKRLSAAEKRLTEPRRVTRTAASKQAPVEVKKATPKVVVTPPPFVLFDVQKRGTVSLAIVGKADAKQLSDLSALRQGERYLGWRLMEVKHNQVRVRSNAGQEVQLEVDA
ncbi:hypothetical protein [Vibrio sp. TBV020]|uniref:hypothetical protein n=1 Tax=Vibrio sp. TBV020 TaxID=3137398 RepID=UPI0038CD38A8